LRHLLAANELEELQRRECTGVLKRNAYGRERRREERRDLEVVAADDRTVLRYPNPSLG